MDRRGVSPVIAVLLLVVIAVAAAVLTYIWILSYTGSLQQQGNTQQLQERLKIDGVQASENSLTVYVRNIGDSKVEISSLYLIQSGSIKAQTTYSGKELAANSVTTCSLTIEGDDNKLQSGTTYTVKVVTASGTEASYTFTYRSGS